MLVGGGLSSSPRFADRLGVFVPRADAPEVVAAMTAAYRDHGNRDKRTRARIKFLLAAWGPERFREVVERDYLGRRLEDGPEAPPSPEAHRDHVGVHRQMDGASYIGTSPLVGRHRWRHPGRGGRAGPRAGRGPGPAHHPADVLDVPTIGSRAGRLDALDLPSSPASSTGDGLHRPDLLQAGPGADQEPAGRL